MHTMKHDAHDEHHQLRADIEEAMKGLWANIRAKQARGEKPAKKGSEAYNKAVKAAKRINAMDETGPLEALAASRPVENTIKEASGVENSHVKAFVEECNRLSKILRDDDLFEKERQKYKNDSTN